MKYIKLFEKSFEYDNFRNSSEWITPNVSYVVEASKCNFQPYVKPAYTMTAGDIAYWNGSKVETVSPSEWNTSLGEPVGVVVIPKGMLPDGKARIIGIEYRNGTWSTTNTDTPLPNYTMVPTTDNAGSTSTGSNSFGALPSDNTDGVQSYVDPLAKYPTTSNLIPSPYLDRKLNPEYYKELSGGNMLSDFNGFSNTQTLVGLGSVYQLANNCWSYSDGVSNLQWYLPAMGELGFLGVRIGIIQNSFTLLGYSYSSAGVIVSSTEYDSNNYCCLKQTTGSESLISSCDISNAPKNFIIGPAYPFAMLD